MNKDFWKGKKVFVTGHTGYKGTWLVYWLTKMGASVTGYALKPVQGAMFNQLDMRLAKDVRGDICNITALSEEINKAEPEIIFHLAACANIQDCIINPVEAVNTNVMGTTNLMESARNCSTVKAIVCVTSDKVYFGECDKRGFRETETYLGALEPYSASKVAQEVIVQSYKNTYMKDRGIVTVRASNVLGFGDPYKERLVPNILSCFANNKVVNIRSPKAIRPWQNVLDCLEGYLVLAECVYDNPIRYSGEWNIGPDIDSMKDVEWIVDKIKLYWGEDARYVINDDTTTLPEKMILKLCIEKSITNLGWRPRWSLEDTLNQIVRLEKELLSGSSPSAIYDMALKQHMSYWDHVKSQT